MEVEVVMLPSGALPANGRYIAVVAEEWGTTPAERYLAGETGSGSLPAERPLVAVLRPAPLETGDDVRCAAATRKGSRFEIALESRRYEGPLAANVTTIVLVQVALGSLAPGSYSLEAVEESLRYDERDAPERVRERVSVGRRLEFDVRR